MCPARPALSLRGRALSFLSRREHSRAELARKLAPHAESADAVDAVLDALEREGWLSAARFAESLVHRKAARVGTGRIVQELQQHRVDPQIVESTRADLRATEAERAHAVWVKKFGRPPVDPRDYARQMRFLLSRGFSAEICARLVAMPRGRAASAGVRRGPGDDEVDPGFDPAGEA